MKTNENQRESLIFHRFLLGNYKFFTAKKNTTGANGQFLRIAFKCRYIVFQTSYDDTAQLLRIDFRFYDPVCAW